MTFVHILILTQIHTHHFHLAKLLKKSLKESEMAIFSDRCRLDLQRIFALRQP